MPSESTTPATDIAAPTYSPVEAVRLIETVRRIANVKRKPCPDCSCHECADCHCSLEHARRDRMIAMADQLEAAYAKIVDADAILSAANAEVATLRTMRASAQREIERLAVEISAQRTRYAHINLLERKEFRDRCQFCLGVKGGELGKEQTVGGALACAECYDLVQAAIDNAVAPSIEADGAKGNALLHIELLAFTGTQTAIVRGDDDGQRRAAIFRYIRETARAALGQSAISDDAAADLGRVIQDAGTRAAEIARQESTGERISLVTPIGGTVTDPDELAMYRELKAQNIAVCATCRNTGWLVDGTIFCACPFGEFLAKKIRAHDTIPGEHAKEE